MALESFDRSVAEQQQDAPGVETEASADVVINVTGNIETVEADWRLLERVGIASPGQSFDFLRQWISSFDIQPQDCVFVIAKVGGLPIAALALQSTTKFGVRFLTSFPGDHVGSNAPLLDMGYWQGLSVAERRALWQSILQHLGGADLLHICGVPQAQSGEDVFEGFGIATAGGDLHRAEFENWTQCDTTQRSKSRRKHDRQQGAKLDAMGEVSFEVLESDGDIDAVLGTMFAQRNDRFKLQGIRDPFDSDSVRSFYRDVFKAGSALKGRLHVLRLNGEVVATRYNLVHGNRIFCLISSMSVAPEIQPGSPGKQCLLRVMQTEFDNGYAMFDMGQGMTDEKRHWCNVHILVRQFYAPLTFVGGVMVRCMTAMQSLRMAIKGNKKLFSLVKSVRAMLSRR